MFSYANLYFVVRSPKDRDPEEDKGAEDKPPPATPPPGSPTKTSPEPYREYVRDSSSPAFEQPQLSSAFPEVTNYANSPATFQLSYTPQARFSPPVFRLSEVCSPAPETTEAQFTPLQASSPLSKEDSATFRLADLSEPGYKLDLQSGQLQIHLDLSSGDVLNLSALPEAETGSPLPPPPPPDSSFVQPTYYEMSSTVSSMDESESSQSIYPYTFNGAGGAASGSSGAGNASSPYNLSNRYSDLYSPSLYSQYYQGSYPAAWTGAQTPGTH